MENQSIWKAKLALACYLTLAVVILGGSILLGLVFLGMGLDYQDLPFPFAFISLPINETIILGITPLYLANKSVTPRIMVSLIGRDMSAIGKGKSTLSVLRPYMPINTNSNMKEPNKIPPTKAK